MFYTLFWVSIVIFEQVNVGWICSFKRKPKARLRICIVTMAMLYQRISVVTMAMLYQRVCIVTVTMLSPRICVEAVAMLSQMAKLQRPR